MADVENTLRGVFLFQPETWIPGKMKARTSIQGAGSHSCLSMNHVYGRHAAGGQESRGVVRQE